MIPEEIIKNNLIPFEEDEIKAYLDRAICSWRKKRDSVHLDSGHDDHEIAVYYIDAFQSVRMSLFGELLPVEDKDV